MIDNRLLYILTLFFLLGFMGMVIDSYFFYSALTACNQVPSSPVLEATHANGLMRQSCGYASPLIPEFCADKLGRGINETPAHLMKR